MKLSFNLAVLMTILSCFSIPKLNAQNKAGDLDVSFNPSGILPGVFSRDLGDRAFNTISEIIDQKILLLTSTESCGSVVIRLNADGSLDSSFGNGGVQDFGGCRNKDYVQLIPVSNNRVLLIGRTNGDLLLSRLDANGAIDTTFGSGSDHEVIQDFGAFVTINNAARDQEGKVLIVGRQSNNVFLARVLENGNLDSGPNGFGRVTPSVTGGSTSSGFLVRDLERQTSTQEIAKDVAIQSDGKMVIIGESFDTLATRNNIFIARFLANGSNLDSSFSENGFDIPNIGGTQNRGNAIAIQTDGKIVGVGKLDNALVAIRYCPDNGQLDNGVSCAGVGFGLSGRGFASISLQNSAEGSDLGIQSDGKLVIGGTFSGNQLLVVRLCQEGQLDTNSQCGPGFGDGGIVTTSIGSRANGDSLALSSDGKILLAGGSDLNLMVARFLGETAPATTPSDVPDAGPSIPPSDQQVPNAGGCNLMPLRPRL